MKSSSKAEVLKMYEETADSYDKMMDAEIGLSVYSDSLERLRERIARTPGTLIDTACGSGHMLYMYHEQYDQRRPLLGVDLSPRMVGIAARRLGSSARVVVGDMSDLSMVNDGVAVAVINFFSLHHLDPDNVAEALQEWNRVLRPGGQLLLATWEGSGSIDYGDESDIVALRYRLEELHSWVQAAGFVVSQCVVEPVEEIPMDAIYLEGEKRLGKKVIIQGTL